MLFNSIQFMLFLPLVLLVYYVLPDRVKYIWLLICSCFFYMCWNAAYITLIAGSIVVTYACGLWLARLNAAQLTDEERSKKKKAVVALCLVINLGILFFFKYFYFMLDNLNLVLSAVNIQLNRPSFDILLPVGISFYTFQALGYTIDVYRGEIKAERNLLRYALFVSFFPQLVAGPIERSKNLLSQLETPKKFRFENMQEGLYLMLWGFFMKIVIADRIAIFVDQIYGPNYADYGGLTVIAATVLFAVQIYCDFGGYSAIAMGSAKMLGVELMENFNTPYFSRSVAEFWRRWHISLSSWFKDYLYIPLGGNRKGKLRKHLNIMITFAVSGLWHGANWGFVVWGALNGLYQVIGDWLRPLRKKLSGALYLKEDSLGYRLGQMLITFALIDVSWVFFRAHELRPALTMLRSMLYIKPEVLLNWVIFAGALDEPNILILFAALILLTFADVLKYRGVKVRARIMEQDWLFQALVISLSAAAILLFGVWGGAYNAASFIYFQF